MAHTPAISVALCTHNGERFVGEQLESILRQSLPPDEVVISDDASTDSTVSIIERVLSDARASEQSSFPRVVLLKNSSALGVASNFGAAIAHCTSTLVALSDQDDVWAPDRLRLLTTVFESRPELLLLHGNAELIDGTGASLHSTLFQVMGVTKRTQQQVHRGQALRILLRRNIATGATVLFRRKLGEAALPVPAGWLHDEWLAMFAALTGQVDLIPESLVYYRQHGANHVGAENLTFVGKVRRVVQHGSERNARLLDRAASLSIRAHAIPGLGAAELAEIDAKLQHERARSSLPVRRVARVPLVLGGLARGQYRRYGRGLADALRDLVQPLDSAD